MFEVPGANRIERGNGDGGDVPYFNSVITIMAAGKEDSTGQRDR